MPDARTYKSRLYLIYNDPDVKDDLNRHAQPEEPLPDLVINGYYLLGYDWRETARAWQDGGFKTPPVMITVANRTETAARIKYAFERKKVRIDELCDPDRTLHIDSSVLEEAETTEEPIAEIGEDEETSEQGDNGPARKLTKKQQAELLRLQVDTVGRAGKPGEQIQSVISIGMLSEGWDAKTVTHIMGLCAFTSQLLCEQVVRLLINIFLSLFSISASSKKSIIILRLCQRYRLSSSSILTTTLLSCTSTTSENRSPLSFFSRRRQSA